LQREISLSLKITCNAGVALTYLCHYNPLPGCEDTPSRRMRSNSARLVVYRPAAFNCIGLDDVVEYRQMICFNRLTGGV